LDFNLPKDSVCLITDDGSPTTANLAQLLIDRGWKVIVVSFPSFLVPQQSSLPAGVDRIVLPDLEEDSLKQIVDSCGSITAFIHLHPQAPVELAGKLEFLEEDRAIVKQIFLMAKHLKQTLNRSADRGYSCFLTVARLDGAFGLGENYNYSPIAGGLFGLTKTLNQEWQSVFCRAIDLSPNLDREKSARHIFAELHDPNRCLLEVAYGERGRVTLRG
jgi:nucleoside-diphosphate-sugar epimerase